MVLAIASALLSWQGVLSTSLLLLFLYGWHPIKRWRYRHIPGPPPVWLLGNLLGLAKQERPQALQAWAKIYGPIYKIFEGGSVVVIISDASAVRTVNMQNHVRPPLLTLFAGKEGKYDDLGLFFTDGQYWQSLRQAWQAMFHPDSLKDYVGFINQSADHLVDALQPAAKSGEVLEVWRMMGRLTLEVIGSAAFGLELKPFELGKELIEADGNQVDFDDSADDLGVVIQKVAAVTLGLSVLKQSLYPVFSILFPELKPLIGRLVSVFPDKLFRRVLLARRKMMSICLSLVEESRKAVQAEAAAVDNGKPQTATENGTTHRNGNQRGLPPGGFVHHMVKADNKLLGRPFTDSEIAAQAIQFLLAGYETTSSTLAFTIYLLAQYPDVEAKLLQEIDSFGRDRDVSFNDLDSFPYLNACIDESLRILPPGAYGTIRLNRKDTVLCGKLVPKGAYINTGQFFIHHCSKYWQDPEVFRPERFMTADGDQNPAWFAFGQGGRSCVGRRLAHLEIQVALIKLYQRYTFKLVPGQVPLETSTFITMQPKNGIHVTVHSRA